MIDMNDNTTKQDLHDLGKSLEKKIDKVVSKAVDDLTDVIAGLAQSMHNETVELRVENKEIKESINRLVNTLDGFVARINSYETEMAARDSQFNQLVEWARKVSKKTGIPLENL
jgi:hypothetical protein